MYPIKKKSVMYSTFKDIKMQVKLEFGKRVDNNGMKYTNGQFLDLFKSEGVIRWSMVTCAPQQYGLAERMSYRKGESYFEDCRSIQFFWEKAAKTTCHVVNICQAEIEIQMSMKMWMGKVVDYSALHSFGCLTYVMNNV